MFAFCIKRFTHLQIWDVGTMAFSRFWFGFPFGPELFRRQ